MPQSPTIAQPMVRQNSERSHNHAESGSDGLARRLDRDVVGDDPPGCQTLRSSTTTSGSTNRS